MSQPDTRLSAILASIWGRGHAAELASTISAGEVGCVTCGWRGPKGDVRQRRGSRFGECPACGLDLYQGGFLSGDDVARICA